MGFYGIQNPADLELFAQNDPGLLGDPEAKSQKILEKFSFELNYAWDHPM